MTATRVPPKSTGYVRGSRAVDYLECPNKRCMHRKREDVIGKNAKRCNKCGDTEMLVRFEHYGRPEKDQVRVEAVPQ